MPSVLSSHHLYFQLKQRPPIISAAYLMSAAACPVSDFIRVRATIFNGLAMSWMLRHYAPDKKRRGEKEKGRAGAETAGAIWAALRHALAASSRPFGLLQATQASQQTAAAARPHACCSVSQSCWELHCREHTSLATRE